MTTYSYRAYGVSLVVDTQIPGLSQEPTRFEQARIAVNLSSKPDWAREAIKLPFCIEHPTVSPLQNDDTALVLTSFGTREFFQLTYSDGASFLLDAGATRVWGTYVAPLTIEDAATYLLGPVMGFALRRRGAMALHASSVCIGGQAVALCGPSETGKSTIAAALALRDKSVLCDDITALEQSGEGFQVQPAYPRICLWPSAVQNLFTSCNALPKLTPTWEKRYLALNGDNVKFEGEKRALGGVYLLAPRTSGSDAPRIEKISAREALLGLVQNIYMNWLPDGSRCATEFTVLSDLVTRVPVRRLVPHVDAARIGELCELIVNDARSLVACEDSAGVVHGL